MKNMIYDIRGKIVLSILTILLLVHSIETIRVTGMTEDTNGGTNNSSFKLAHLSDIHIGYYLYPNDMIGSVENFTDVLQSIKTIKPDRILITGDLVEYDKPEFFMAFKNLLRDINIPFNTTIGNHDRRNVFFLFGDGTSDYDTYINYINNPSNSSDNDYFFDFKGYRFIGLDSGSDYNASIVRDYLHPTDDELRLLWQKASLCYTHIRIGDNIEKCLQDEGVYDSAPESKGLSDSQMIRLRNEFDSSTPKIIFMHHPAMDSQDDIYGWPQPVPVDGAPGGNDNSIANNRWNFINYTKDSNVRLVLTGHSHRDSILDINGNPVPYTNNNRPLFVQTRSATKDEGYTTHGYRVIEINGEDIQSLNSYTPVYSRISGTIYANPSNYIYRMEIHAYDANNSHTGMNDDCNFETKIPSSYYTGDYEGNSLIPQTIVGYSNDVNIKTIKKFKVGVSRCLNTNTVRYSAQSFGNSNMLLENDTSYENNLHENNISLENNISFNMTIEDKTDIFVTKIDFNNVGITVNSTATIDIRDNISDYTMDIDLDNDGMVDRIIKPNLSRMKGDINNDGRVDKNEAIQAVVDYFDGIITKQEAIEIVINYFGG